MLYMWPSYGKNGEMQLKKTIRCLLPAVVICAAALVLWHFSDHNAEQSNTLSRPLAESILSFFGVKATQEQIKTANWIVRKAAHFSLFFCLGFGVAGTLQPVVKRRMVTFFCTVAVGVVLAVSDELHQLFSTGRYSSVWDILLDSFGALCGLLIYFAVSIIFRKRKAWRSKFGRG